MMLGETIRYLGATRTGARELARSKTPPESRYRSHMAGESSAASGTRLSGRVWFVLLCATIVIVFLGVVLPGVYDLKHSKRSYVVTEPIGRIVVDSKGTASVDVSLSRDGHVHILRTSAISKDSRLIDRSKVHGKTLTLGSSCTGSRLGILRRCDVHYHLRVPKRTALSLRLHFGRVTVTGVEGRIDFRSDAGDFTGTSCSKRAYFHIGFGRFEFHDTCVPTIVRAKVKAGAIILTVPAGRYDVQAGSEAQRPFANIIEDPHSPSMLDLDVGWVGSIDVKGTRR